MADHAARFAIVVRRYQIARFTIRIAGIDLSARDVAMEVRAQPDTPGSPLIRLNKVETASAEGIKIEATTEDGIPVTYLRGRINKSTMSDAAKVPYMGELGSPSPLFYGIVISDGAATIASGGDATERFYGEFIVEASAFGSDAAPLNRPQGYGINSPRIGGGGTGSVTFGDTIVNVSISDADVIAAMAAAVDNAAALSQAWATGTAPGGTGTKSAREWAEGIAGITRVESVNLLDTTTMLMVGSYASTSNVIVSNVAWTGAKIPLPEEATHVSWMTNAARRVGSTFLDAAGVPLSGAYLTDGGAANTSYSRAIPAGAKFLFLNLKSDTIPLPSQVMVNVGQAALPYQAYAGTVRVKKAALPLDTQQIQKGLIDDILTEVTVTGDNLLDLATMRVPGTYVGGSNVLNSDAAWAGARIPKPDGATDIAWRTNAARRTGSTFLDAAGVPLSGAYQSDGGLANTSYTRPWPAGAAFFFLNIQSNTVPQPSEIMVNNGTVALPYAPYQGTKQYRVRADAIEQGGSSGSSVLVLSGAGPAESYVESARSGRLIRHGFTPFPTKTLTSKYNRFNLTSQSIDGVVLRTADDDVAPDHVEGATLGAAHGYTMGRATAAGHGKTASDEGSVWTSGGVEVVLVKVESATSLLIAHRTLNVAPPTGTFTHVSGAAATGSFTVTAVVSIQWYPPHNNYSLRCWVDGREVVQQSGEWRYDRDVQFVEVGDVLARATIINWWIANGGARAGLVPQGAALYRTVITYRFDRDGQMTIHRTWTILAATLISDLMGFQVGRVNNPLQYRVPGAEPFTYDGSTVDYGRGVATDRTLASGATVAFVPARLQAAGGEYAHRIISLWSDYFLSTGFLPIGDAAYNVRRNRVSTSALEIRGNTGKIYGRVIDKGDFTAQPGDQFEAVAFWYVGRRPASGPLVSIVRPYEGRAYIYLDWADEAGISKASLPEDMIGWEMERLDSRNAALISGKLATGEIAGSASASGNHGYLVLRAAA